MGNIFFLLIIMQFTSDEDLISITVEAKTESHLVKHEITFLEHKTNGKSKGSAFLLFKSNVAARMTKDFMEKIEIHGKKPIIAFSPVTSDDTFVNPYRTTNKDTEKKSSNDSRSNRPSQYRHQPY